MRSILYFLFLVSIHSLAMAQNPKTFEVRGTINDYSNQEIVLKIKGFEFTSRPELNGNFTILSPVGRQILQIFENKIIVSELPITVKGDSKLNIGSVSLKSTKIDEVIITGQHEAQSLKNSVYQVRVINQEKIKLRSPTNIQQVLSTELGFRFSNDLTLGTSDVELMGMSGRNVKILLDGVPMTDRSDTRESLNQIDINSVERIEIVEGPMSVAYGSDALAGVINIITKKNSNGLWSVAAKIREESAGKEYEALNGKGLHAQNVSLSWQKKGFNATAGVSHTDFGGFNIPLATATVLPTVKWLPKEQWFVNGKLGYAHAKLNVWYRIDALKEDLDSKSAMNANNYRAKFANYKTDRIMQQIQGDLIFNDRLSLNSSAGYTTLQRATITKIHDFASNLEELTNDPGEQDVANFNSGNIRSTLVYKPSKFVSFQPGIEMNFDHANGARIKGNPSINDYAIFASAEFLLTDWLTVRPGLRAIKNSIYNAPPVMPSLNAKIRLIDELDFRLGYAKGFRAPALRELYYDFFDASHSIRGNPNLKAEESNSFTGSLLWNNGIHKTVRFSTTLSGFYNDFTNRIDFGQSADDATLTTLINVGKYKTTGATLENHWVWKALHATVGLAYIGRYNKLSEQELQFNKLPTFVWSPEVNSSIIYNFSKISTDLSINYKYSGGRPTYQLQTVNGNQVASLIKTGSYHITDLFVSKKLMSHFVLNGGIKNLFNVTTVNSTIDTGNGGAHSSGSSNPISYGRSFVLGLTFNFTKN